MANKTLNTRIQLKTDSPENWSKAENFSPLKGEVIIYQDENNSDIKIGDGNTNVNNLPFLVSEFGTDNQAIAPNSIAIGEGAIAGCKGYYIVSVRPNIIEVGPFTEKLADSDSIGSDYIGENYLPSTHAIGYNVSLKDYEVGDKISVKTGHIPYLDCATITAIYDNEIHFEGTLPTFTKDESHSGNTVFVVRKPECGVVNLFN